MSVPAELVLRSDQVEVVLLPEIGGRIHRLRAFGEDVVRTPRDPRTHASDPFFWGAYLMAPWCNRAGPGPIHVAGRLLHLPPNFADGTAIHGQLAARPWEVRADGSLGITGGGDGDPWPWAYEVTASVALEGSCLALSYELVNRANAPMPAGVGLHPWFRRPVEVRLPADAAYASNTGSAPQPEPVAGRFDLRAMAVPANDLDATWTDLGEARVELAWPGLGIGAELAIQAERTLVAVATPPDIDAIAIEPQTHAPDGLRRLANGEPDAPTVLQPGAALRLGLRMTFEGTTAAG